jgi:ATP-dependent protease ClpP protease subunit
VRLWFRILAQADGQAADVYIYDVIGKSFWDDETVTAKKFIDDLAALPESVTTLRVHVNSPGGDVFDAVAIANALRAQSTERKRTIEVSIEGLAASAATIVTSAGDTIRIADNALLMVHNPAAIVWGPAGEMRKMAEVLETVRDAIIATYRWVSQLSVEAIGELMDATTWMDADSAVKNGFATEVITGMKVTALADARGLALLPPVPEAYRARFAARIATPVPAPAPTPAPTPAPAPPPSASAADVLRECTAAGCLELAEELVGAQATLDQVRARLATAREIRGLCAAAKLPELAEGYLRAATPVDVVKTQLTTITATLDARTEINGHLPPQDRPTASRARLDPVAIYAERNRHALAKGASA